MTEWLRGREEDDPGGEVESVLIEDRLEDERLREGVDDEAFGVSR